MKPLEMETDSLKFQTSGLRARNSPHNVLHLALIVLNCATFVVMLVINAASSQPTWGKQLKIYIFLFT